VEGAALRNTVT